MSRAVSSAVISEGRPLAARTAAATSRGNASNKRSEISKRGPKSDPGNKRTPAVANLSSSRRTAEPAARERRNPARVAAAPTASVLSIPSKSASRVAPSARGARPAGRPQILPVPAAKAPIARFDTSARVMLGRAGDHPDIFQLLLAVFQGPSREEFSAGQDDPNYEPANRLLVRQGGRLVSHVQLLPRMVNFGRLRLPFDRVNWLATLPEFRSQGYAGMLLEAAARSAAGRATTIRISQRGSTTHQNASWGILRTRVPKFFHRRGWAVCGRHSSSRAKARNILARYWTDAALRTPALNIRLWRHVELAALMRIYAQNTERRFGPLVRSEDYWRWLISRKAFDHIIVAIAGPDKLELDEATAPIVGYAVVRQQRVVELLTDPAYPNARLQLLARACSDAIERDQQEIVLEASPDDPLHEFIAASGGQFLHRELDADEVYMVRRPEVASLVRSLAPLWEARVAESGRAKSFELGLLVGDEKYLLTIGRRGSRSASGRLSRNYIACSSSELTRLAMGHSDPAEAAEGGRLFASTQIAMEIATLLFPRLPIWHPSWDDLAC